MEGFDWKKLCEQQGELSKMYMEQQFRNRQMERQKYLPFKCVLCKKQKYGFGNNPVPCCMDGRCCDDCNRSKVVPARVSELAKDLDDMWK